MEPGGARGTVRRVLSGEPRVRVALDRAFPKGTPLVLDLPDLVLAGGRIRSRAVDDLCAVALCLALFDRLADARWRGSVGALFTRAEEVGFAGALGWVRTTEVPRSTTIVNLEMSNARLHTPQGKGPILRVGDRVTTFDASVGAELEAAAKRLGARAKTFRWQRALMDGGACEATVYAHAGFRTGALCLPLRNYHNHAPKRGVAMEYVDADDAASLLLWMEAYARGFARFRGDRATERRLERLWRKNRAQLVRSAGEGAGPRR